MRETVIIIDVPDLQGRQILVRVNFDVAVPSHSGTITPVAVLVDVAVDERQDHGVWTPFELLEPEGQFIVRLDNRDWHPPKIHHRRGLTATIGEPEDAG